MIEKSNAVATGIESINNIKDGTINFFQDIKSFNYDILLNNWLIPYGSKIIIALIIFIVGRMVARLISNLIGKAAYRSSKDEMLKSFFTSISYFLLLLIVVIITLAHLGINTNSLVALIGAAGLAVAFALQGSLQNFAAGVMILLFKPFHKGHYIETNSVAGRVEQLGILVLEIRTPDNKTVLVPNSKVFSDTIINYSVNKKRRIDFIFDIAYDADIKKAKAIIKKCFAEEKRVLNDPEPVIMVGSLAASSVQLFARPWVITKNYWDVHFYLMEKIKVEFDKAGIEIPYNKLDINLPDKSLG